MRRGAVRNRRISGAVPQCRTQGGAKRHSRAAAHRVRENVRADSCFRCCALCQVEERWSYALLQTSHLFHLLVGGFSCTSVAQLEQHMYHTRIDQTIEYLLANREMIRQRLKETDAEWPVFVYRFVFGTFNNYTFKRFQQHFATFDHLYRYLRCMAFALRSLPFDDFHNAAVQSLRVELHDVSVQLSRWLQCVLDHTRVVHRSAGLKVALHNYSVSVENLFRRYLDFRAEMYFGGNLFLVDMGDGRKGMLRQAAETHKHTKAKKHFKQPDDESDDMLQSTDDEHDGAASHPSSSALLELPMLRTGVVSSSDDPPPCALPSPPAATPSVAPTRLVRSLSQEPSHIRFHLDDEDDCESKADAVPSVSPPAVAPAIPSDFTWTSEDVISLNFFFFQLNEFTKRALKFVAEPGEESAAHDRKEGFDPVHEHHLGSVRRAPHFLAAFLRSFVAAELANLRESCRWDRRRCIESVKLALAICIASLNELVPTSWPHIYTRLSHGWWAPVTVAFTISDNLGLHFSANVMRVLGTIVGAMFGYVVSRIAQGSITVMIVLLTAWNGFTTFYRDHEQFGYAHLVAGFTAVVIAVGAATPNDVSNFAIVRVEETLVGVLVGMAVQNLILPLRAGELLHTELLSNLQRIQFAFAFSFGKYQIRAGEHEQHQQQQQHPPQSHLPPPHHVIDVPPNGAPGDSLSVPVPSQKLLLPSPRTPLSSSSIPLVSGHSFRRLGPLLFRSIDQQTTLVRAADSEPTLWHPSFPVGAWMRVLEVERSICLYLFCMDLALQRIIQSNAHFVMPEMMENFRRIKSGVNISMEQIAKGLTGYQHRREARNKHTDNAPADGSPLSPVSSSSSSCPSSSPVSSSSAGLLSLRASLVDLEASYKRWIDKRIMHRRQKQHDDNNKRNQQDKRNTGTHEAEDVRHHPGSPRSAGSAASSSPPVGPASVAASTSPSLLPVLSAAAPALSPALCPSACSLSPSPCPAVPSPPVVAVGFVSADSSLTTIPLYTPKMRSRGLRSNTRSFTMEPLQLANTYTQVDPEAAAAATSATAATAQPAAGLSHMDLTFTRSMDVLALNTFLFATKGSQHKETQGDTGEERRGGEEEGRAHFQRVCFVSLCQSDR